VTDDRVPPAEGEDAARRPYKPYDVVMKQLLDADPAGWLRYVGVEPRGPVRVIDSDLSTVLPAADKVIRVDDPEPWLAQFEAQSSQDPELPLRMLQYSVHLTRRHGLPVRSVVIVLRPEAGAGLVGVFQQHYPVGAMYLEFRYSVVRVWDLPVESILSAGLWILPLAPVTDLGRTSLTSVIERMAERVEREATPDEAKTFWTGTFFMMGLRYPESVIRQLVPGVREMRESVTYQLVLDEGRAEGRVEEAKRIMALQGRTRFGPPNARTQEIIDELSDLEEIERLAQRLVVVSSWDELFDQSHD
jgi:predicted transposase YdaD